MQDAKTKASVLPQAALSSDDVRSEPQHTEHHAVSADAGSAVSAESIALSAEPQLAEAESEISLHCSTVDHGDVRRAADNPVLYRDDHTAVHSSVAGRCGNVCDLVSDTVNVASVFVDTGAVFCGAEHISSTDLIHTEGIHQLDEEICRPDADWSADSRCQVVDDTAVKVTSADVGTAPASCDTEFISSVTVTISEASRQACVAAVSHDVTSQLDLGSILAESFVSNTCSAASVVSMQATIGCPPVTCETSTSSELRASAPGT